MSTSNKLKIKVVILEAKLKESDEIIISYDEVDACIAFDETPSKNSQMAPSTKPAVVPDQPTAAAVVMVNDYLLRPHSPSVIYF